MSEIRTFETGATRDAEGDKPDYEGFLCPLVFEAYGKYMTKHRKQADGKLRDSDNWQKGIPMPQYMKSLFRHLVQLWKLHRGHEVIDDKGHEVTVEDACCAIVFNSMGYLHEWYKRPVALEADAEELATEWQCGKCLHEYVRKPRLKCTLCGEPV